jgi:hypothetical protein
MIETRIDAIVEKVPPLLTLLCSLRKVEPWDKKREKESLVLLNRVIEFYKDASGRWSYRHKNIALLQNSTFALVSKSARVGDILCHLGSGSEEVAHVMRELSDTNINAYPNIKATVLPEMNSEIVRLFRRKIMQSPYSS